MFLILRLFWMTKCTIYIPPALSVMINHPSHFALNSKRLAKFVLKFLKLPWTISDYFYLATRHLSTGEVLCDCSASDITVYWSEQRPSGLDGFLPNMPLKNIIGLAFISQHGLSPCLIPYAYTLMSHRYRLQPHHLPEHERPCSTQPFRCLCLCVRGRACVCVFGRVFHTFVQSCVVAKCQKLLTSLNPRFW